MFKVLRGNIYSYQKEEIGGDYLKKFYEAENGANWDYRIAVYDGKHLLGVLGIEDVRADRSYYPASFVHSEDIFQRVNAALKNERGECILAYGQLIGVTDETGNILYCLKWSEKKENSMLNMANGVSVRNYPSYRDWTFDEKILDLTLLESAELFIFEEFSEYACALTAIIRKNFPDSVVLFLDKTADLFYRDQYDEHLKYVKKSAVPMEINSKRKLRIMYVTANETETDSKLKSIMKIHTVTELLNNVLWPARCGATKPLSEYKYIYLMSGKNALGGFGAILRSTAQMDYFFGRRGLELVSPEWSNMMYTYEGFSRCFDTGMDYNFDLNEHNRDEVFVISSLQGVLYTNRMLFNPEFTVPWNALITPAFRKQLDDKVREILPAGKRVLGCINRGTDYADKKPKGYPVQADAPTMIRRAKAMMQAGKYEYVYLATEDASIFEEYSKAFGDKLLSVDQHRYTKEEIANVKILGEIVRNKDSEYKDRQMVEYFSVIYVLSRCNAFLASGRVGGQKMAQDLNLGNYEEEFIYELGRYA